MNLHTASCEQIYLETSVYDRQNKLNELALEKGKMSIICICSFLVIIWYYIEK